MRSFRYLLLLGSNSTATRGPLVEGTPYAGGYFRVKFRFTNEFPAAPPKCLSILLAYATILADSSPFVVGWFATKIFHPNVGSNGEICVNTLKKDWKPEYGIGHILVTVKCLLIYPNPESALDEEAGKLLLEEYASYCRRAKLITSVHATPRVKPIEFQTPSAPQASSSKDNSATESVASTSKLETSTTPTSSPPPLNSTSPTKVSTPLVVPVVIRKSASPAPPMSLKIALAGEKEGLSAGPHKERHPSPSPLGTADSNVGGGKAGMGVRMGMASATSMGTVTGTRAVKRAATSSVPTNAEKRKKALKRL